MFIVNVMPEPVPAAAVVPVPAAVVAVAAAVVPGADVAAEAAVVPGAAVPELLLLSLPQAAATSASPTAIAA